MSACCHAQCTHTHTRSILCTHTYIYTYEENVCLADGSSSLWPSLQTPPSPLSCFFGLGSTNGMAAAAAATIAYGVRNCSRTHTHMPDVSMAINIIIPIIYESKINVSLYPVYKCRSLGKMVWQIRKGRN